MSDSTLTDPLRADSLWTTSSEPLPVFVGHESAVKSFQAILEKREPAFVVVTGQPGMGKTSFLRFVGAGAAASGWTVLPKEGNAVFSVTPETTEKLFSMQIRELMATRANENFIETKSSARLDVHPIVRQLRERAPVLLLIDGFLATSDFTSWFNDQFIKGLKQTKLPVVVTIAERPHQIEHVTAHADEILPFGKLDKELIKEHFKRIGKQLNPPIEASELEEYAGAAFEKPELLGSLTRVLRLASQI